MNVTVFFSNFYREEKTEFMTEVQEEFEEQKAELQKLRNEVQYTQSMYKHTTYNSEAPTIELHCTNTQNFRVRPQLIAEKYIYTRKNSFEASSTAYLLMAEVVGVGVKFHCRTSIVCVCLKCYSSIDCDNTFIRQLVSRHDVTDDPDVKCR